VIAIAESLKWTGFTVGVLGILSCVLLVVAWAHDKYRRFRARYARGYELPEPHARPAPHFTQKPPLPEPKLKINPTLDPRRKPRLHLHQ